MAMTRKRLLRIGFYGTSGIIFILLLLDPYSRQSMFGPKVQGEPLCYWQSQIRHGTDPNQYQQSLVFKALALLGIRPLSDDAFHLNRANELPVLLTLMDDASADVRAAVAGGLGLHRESAEATEALIRLLDDPNAEVRAAAAWGCLRDGPSLAAGMPRFRQLLDDENLVCRTSAAILVFRASVPPDTKAHHILLNALQDRGPGVRILAVEALCDAAKDFPESIAILSDAARQDRYTRSALAGCAAKFGPRAIPLLTEWLRDPESDVRVRAARSLGELGSDAGAAEHALVHALGDPADHVREAVRAALSKIDPKRFPEKNSERNP